MPPFRPEGSATRAAGAPLPPGWKYGFDGFVLDPHARQLSRDGSLVDLTRAQFALLLAFVTHGDGWLTKDALMKAVWGDQIVDESSVHKLVSDVRRLLGQDHGRQVILNRPRFGYRLGPTLRAVEPERPAVDIEVLLAPHRKWIEGRALMETLGREAIASARTTFESLVAADPACAIYHVGLANAFGLQHESTRTAVCRDVDALQSALQHARRAVEIDPHFAEGFATLGFVLGLSGDAAASSSAFQRAYRLEDDNWLICARHAVVSWGEERYRAASRAAALYPQFTFAYWLLASVLVARGQLVAAEREIDRAEALVTTDAGDMDRFPVVAIHYLKGLLCLARGEGDAAKAAFHRELALEGRGHLYAAECCAHTWHALGALHLFLEEFDDARAAFRQSLARVPHHPQAMTGLLILDGGRTAAQRRAHARTVLQTFGSSGRVDGAGAFEGEMARAALMKIAGDEPGAAAWLREALRRAPRGSAGWLIPLDPLLRIWENPLLWKPVVDTIGMRAS